MTFGLVSYCRMWGAKAGWFREEHQLYPPSNDQALENAEGNYHLQYGSGEYVHAFSWQSTLTSN